MALHDGSLIVLSNGATDLWSALPQLAQLATATRNRVCVLQVRPSNAGTPVALPALPEVPDVFTVRPEHLGAALATFAASDGRLLALLPSRHRGLTRLLAGNEFERLMRPGGLPLLALPANAALPPLQRVLFPADFAPRSEAAFEQTLALCQAFGAELHLMHVYGDDRLLPGENDTARRAAVTSVHDLLALDRERLQRYADFAQNVGISVSAATAEGRAHDAILAYAAANAIDLIVMATHGPRSAEDILLGTTTARTICAAQVPVLAIPA